MSTLLFIPVMDDATATALGTVGAAALRAADSTVTINQISLRQAARTFDPATWSALQHGHGAVAVLIPASLDDEAAKAVRAFAFAAFTGRVRAFTTILCGPSDGGAAGNDARRQALDFIQILDMPKNALWLSVGDLPLFAVTHKAESELRV